MADSRVRPRALPHRLAVVAAALALLALLASSSGAISKQQVENAKAKAKRLAAEAQAAQRELDALGAKLAVQAEKVFAAQDRLSATQAELAQIHEDQSAAQARYDELRAQLDERARVAYMAGPGSSLEFLLGATSLSDLSSRLEFINAITQHDGDLAVEVQNLQNQLAAQEARYQELKTTQQALLAELRAVQKQLHDSLVQQAAYKREVDHKRAAAERYAKKVGKQYQQQLAAAWGGSFHDGMFKVCPVGASPYRIVTDSFGAPRYGGGFHLHAGDDIMADFNTPIYAPFAGYAEASSNSLGGYSVFVKGSEGYVYNAHLIRPGVSGSVQAGDVVGYVGNSGDAQGGSPHDHFEWHPNAIPSGWPQSPYGYSVIGDAVNPYPLLSQVC